MRIIRDRADARWLPSRFNFALFRLFAYLRLRSSRPQPQPGLMLSIDRYQSAAENYIMSIVMVVVVASLFDSIWGVPAAIFGLQLAILVARPIMRTFRSGDSDTTRGGGAIIMTATIAAAAWFARTLVIPRVFLALVVLNGVAAAIMFALRKHVAAIERTFE